MAHTAQPLSWGRPAAPAVKWDMTYDQLVQLGLVPARLGGEAPPRRWASAVFCADRASSEDLTSSPMCVYSGHHLETAAWSHYGDPVSELLALPNPGMTGSAFWSPSSTPQTYDSAAAEIAGMGPGPGAHGGRSNRRR